MSRFDLERFTADMKKNPALETECSQVNGDPKALARWAATRGYDLTPEEAEGLAHSVTELSDDELEDVAGGWTGPDPNGGG